MNTNTNLFVSSHPAAVIFCLDISDAIATEKD